MRPKIWLPLLLLVALIFLVLHFKKPAANYSNVEQERDAQTNTPSLVQSVPQRETTSKKMPDDIFSGLQARTEQMKRDSDRETALWQEPIIYFGMVVDESNQPISGVQVSYGANSMNEAKTEVYNTGTAITDERGIFKIDGVLGVNLMLQLSHPNYYLYPDNSTGFDKRNIPKKGYFSDGQVVGTLQIKAWGDTPKNWSPQPYDWSVSLTVPGGGLVESTNQFDFVAPALGYRQSIKIDLSKDQQGWSDTVDKSFFIKLSSGYARMAIHMRAKTPLYVSLEYYFNPDRSQNLESDSGQ